MPCAFVAVLFMIGGPDVYVCVTPTRRTATGAKPLFFPDNNLSPLSRPVSYETFLSD